MSATHEQSLLEALLDSWDRNNTILLNLLRALPEGGLEARVMEGSPSVAELFTHIHYVRLVFLSEGGEVVPIRVTKIPAQAELGRGTQRREFLPTS
jgi:uncharacterized damage-inducible protein DinB